MLLVYTHKITPRLKYVFKQLCFRILGIPVEFTTTVENFVSHDSLKMSYSKTPLGNEIFVKAHTLLFEQGLSDYTILVSHWENTKCFFKIEEECHLPFDIFAASFYLLSRYEEYLPHVKDEYGGYKMENSLAFREGFLKYPVVDIWAHKFKAILQSHYPDYTFPKKHYSIQPIIDVPSAYYYKSKGILRTLGATLKDVLKLKFATIYDRFMVLASLKKDPYDTFSYIINKQKHTAIKSIVCFQVGDYSNYDKSVSSQSNQFKTLIKHIGDYCKIGLRVSHLAISENETIKVEKQRLEQVINTAVLVSRNSFSKLNLPYTYRTLVELEVQHDYSMGYNNEIGFRASTCTPFLFYDLDYEVQKPLLVHSHQCIDYGLLSKTTINDKKKALKLIMHETKQVQGEFVAIFHNYTFGNLPLWKGFKEIFKIVINSHEK